MKTAVLGACSAQSAGCTMRLNTSCARGGRPAARPPLQLPAWRVAGCGRSRGQRLAVRAATSTAELPPNLKSIVGAFQMVPDEMARYKQLLYLAAKLPPLPAEHQTDDNKVQGCVSQVWVVGDLQDGKLKWQADADSQLTKGLAALLVKGLSDSTPEEVNAHLVVVGVDPGGIIEALGLKQKLTPSRTNGFLNIFRLMQAKSARLGGLDFSGPGAHSVSQAERPAQAESPAAPAASAAAPPAPSGNGSDAQIDGGGTSDGSGSNSARPVYDSIQRKLQTALSPTSLEVVDESAQHAGHAGSRMQPGYSGETHFNVKVVSDAFEGLNTVKRHRTIYGLLQEELSASVHALSLMARTPAEEGSG